MSKRFTNDLKNKKFGRLTVIDFVKKPEYHVSYWLCKCECGNEKIISGNFLLTGNTSSCGCLRREGLAKRLRKEIGESSFTHLFKNYKWSAKKRKYEFALSKEDFKNLTQQNCFYCNGEPSNIIKLKGFYGTYIYNGIDRIDSSKGYIKNNVIPCCKTCNTMKMSLNQDQFLQHINKIYKFQGRLIQDSLNTYEKIIPEQKVTVTEWVKK